MADVLGCSKCRYSERGCARCRDPAFRDRQLAKAQGNVRPIKKSKQSTKLRKRPAHTSGQDVQPERHPDSKRTRFTRKARKAQAPARGVQAGNGGVQHPSYQDLEAKEAALAAVPDTGPTSQADPRYPKTQQTGTKGAEQTQQDHRSSEQHGDSQSIAAEVGADKDKQKESKRKQPELNDGTEAETDAKAAGGGDKQVASGLELGLMAGLLPLQEVSKGSELARRSLEEPTLVGKEPDGMLAPSSDSKRVSEQEAAKPVQSTSEQSKDISQPSTGMQSLDTAQKAQRIESNKERQRHFMEQLQRKVQDRKQQSEASSKPCMAALLASAAKRKKKDKKRLEGDPRVSVWEPPQSPFGLIEEQLFSNPWKLLIACILLNKTSVVQVRKIIWKLFELMPTPEVGMHLDEAVVRELIQPLGLAPKRAPMLIRFCRDYVEKQWTDPKELHGVGQYAADAYNIFCRGDWRSVSPADKDLLKYHQWLTETNGEGVGLLRETEPHPGSQAGSEA